MSMDEESVQKGELYSWQEEVLRQYDLGMDYLEAKYPGHSFVFTGCNPKGRYGVYSTFWFTVEGSTDKYYELYIEQEDGQDICSDTYGGETLCQ